MLINQKQSEVIQLNTILNPSYWNSPTWLNYMHELKIDASKDRLHRKKWELTHTLYGLDRLGCINENSIALDVGAGISAIMYYLANKVKKVIATDLYDYDESGLFPNSAKSDMVTFPEKYAPFPYREDHLEVKKMDCRELEFADNTFDFVYSVSSIEHFGGHGGSKQSMEEIGRVLKPGGIAAITTECILNNKSHYDFFTPKEIERFLIKPSGLTLVESIDYDVDDLSPYIDNPVDMPGFDVYPHFVLTNDEGVVWTSITFFLRKIKQNKSQISIKHEKNLSEIEILAKKEVIKNKKNNKYDKFKNELKNIESFKTWNSNRNNKIVKHGIDQYQKLLIELKNIQNNLRKRELKTSKKGLAKPIAIKARKIIQDEISYSIDPIIEKQNELNAKFFEIIRSLEYENKKLQNKIDSLLLQNEKLLKKINEQNNQNIILTKKTIQRKTEENTQLIRRVNQDIQKEISEQQRFMDISNKKIDMLNDKIILNSKLFEKISQLVEQNQEVFNLLNSKILRDKKPIKGM